MADTRNDLKIDSAMRLHGASESTYITLAEAWDASAEALAGAVSPSYRLFKRFVDAARRTGVEHGKSARIDAVDSYLGDIHSSAKVEIAGAVSADTGVNASQILDDADRARFAFHSMFNDPQSAVERDRLLMKHGTALSQSGGQESAREKVLASVRSIGAVARLAVEMAAEDISAWPEKARDSLRTARIAWNVIPGALARAAADDLRASGFDTGIAARRAAARCGDCAKHICSALGAAAEAGKNSLARLGRFFGGNALVYAGRSLSSASPYAVAAGIFLAGAGVGVISNQIKLPAGAPGFDEISREFAAVKVKVADQAELAAGYWSDATAWLSAQQAKIKVAEALSGAPKVNASAMKSSGDAGMSDGDFAAWLKSIANGAGEATKSAFRTTKMTTRTVPGPSKEYLDRARAIMSSKLHNDETADRIIDAQIGIGLLCHGSGKKQVRTCRTEILGSVMDFSQGWYAIYQPKGNQAKGHLVVSEINGNVTVHDEKAMNLAEALSPKM